MTKLKHNDVVSYDFWDLETQIVSPEDAEKIILSFYNTAQVKESARLEAFQNTERVIKSATLSRKQQMKILIAVLNNHPNSRGCQLNDYIFHEINSLFKKGIHPEDSAPVARYLLRNRCLTNSDKRLLKNIDSQDMVWKRSSFLKSETVFFKEQFEKESEQGWGLFLLALTEKKPRQFMRWAKKNGDFEFKLYAWLVAKAFSVESSDLSPKKLRKRSYGSVLDEGVVHLFSRCMQLENMSADSSLADDLELIAKTSLFPSIEGELIFMAAAEKISAGSFKKALAGQVKDQYHKISLSHSQWENEDALLFESTDRSQLYIKGRLARTSKILNTTSKVALVLGVSRLKRLNKSSEQKEKAKAETIRQVTEILQESAIDLQGAMGKIAQLRLGIESNLSPSLIRQEKNVFSSYVRMNSTQVNSAFKSAFNNLPQSMFSYWEDKPFAGGAIGQVHRANLPSGEKVCVKIRYPDIENSIRQDFDVLKLLAPLGNVFFPNANISNLVSDWERRTLVETNYKQELKNAEQIKKVVSSDYCYVPKVFSEYSGTSILTMEYIEGERLEEFVMSASQEEKNKIAKDLFLSTYEMLKARTIRIDIHIGNYLVCDDRLAMIDFGMVNYLKEGDLNHLQVMTYVLKKDLEGLRGYLIKHGWIKDDEKSQMICEKLLGLLAEPFLEPRFTFTRGYVQRVIDFLINEMGGYANIPKDSVYIIRIIGVMYSILADLKAEACFKEIALDYLVD